MARKNPVPKSSARRGKRVQVLKAARLLEDFTGSKPDNVVRIPKPSYPDAVTVIGECDGILYTTVRDGELEKYIHRFAAKSRPLLCSSPDGKQLFLLGGAYNFTDRGIVDD